MIASVKNAERYRSLIARTLTHRDAPLTPDATTKAITKLATLVHEYDGDTDALWALGECDGIGLSDLLIGAHVYYAEHYGSQWCDEYKALSALGAVVDGGYALQTCATTAMDSTQQIVYDGLVEIN